MYIGYNEEQEALRRELRAYSDRLLTPEVKAELAKEHGIGPTTREITRQMGKDGWLGIGWPKEWGGQGRGEIEQFVFFDESMRARAPVPMLTVNTVGPTLMANGSEEQKKRFLPKIRPARSTSASATRSRAQGPISPRSRRAPISRTTAAATTSSTVRSSGRASPPTRTTAGSPCGPTRKPTSTRPVDVPGRHEDAGIRVDLLDLLSTHDIAAVFYDDVRVLAENLVGGLNQGWKLITGQLNHERATLCAPGMIEGAYDAVVQWAKTRSDRTDAA